MDNRTRTSLRTWVARLAVVIAVVGSLQVAVVVAEESPWSGPEHRATPEVGPDTDSQVVGASSDVGVAVDVTPAVDQDADRDGAEEEARIARQVADLQNRLAELGWYADEVDGMSGPGTEQAIRDFQRAAGLAVDGIAGERTRTALDAPDAVTRAQWEQEQEARPAPTASPTPTPTPSPSPTPTASPSPTAAPEPTPTETCDVQCRGQRALDITPLDAPPGWTITFEPGQDHYLGMAYGGARKEIVIWIRDSHSDRQVAATLMHEMGHAWDFEGLAGQGDSARETWAGMRGFEWKDRDRWFGMDCMGCYGYAIGGEDLAESVPACLRPGWDAFRSELAGPPTPAQCDYLRTIVG